MVEPNTIAQIVRLADVAPAERVVEVGAGLGSLTLGLLDVGCRVLAVETDAKLIAGLRLVLAQRAPDDRASAERAPDERASGDRPLAESGEVQVLHADARALDWPATLDATGWQPTASEGWSMVSNLPYNVATSLVIDFLDDVAAVDKMLVMCQLEAAQRLVARANQPAYGAVSVRVALKAHANIVGRVPPTVFWPQPKVTSALVRVTRHHQRAADDVEQQAKRLLRAGFGRRRQMLRRTLRQHVTLDAFAAAGIDPTSRAEQLDVGEWLGLARASLER